MAQSDVMSREERLLADCEDAMFRLAVARFEVRRAEVVSAEADAGDALLTPEAMDHAYEIARPRILRRARREGYRGVRRRLLSRGSTMVAMLLVLALVGGISALAVSPEMRQRLSRLLVDPQTEFTAFEMDRLDEYPPPDVPDEFKGDFFPSYIPAGFIRTDASWYTVVYESEDDRRFFYDDMNENTSLNLDTENAEVTYTKVGGTDAMLVQKNGMTTVVWSFANHYFLVSGMEMPDEVMKIAESLVVIDR